MADESSTPNERPPAMPDLALLLAESDREDPFLAPPRRPGGAPEPDALDPQILAGLVNP